MKKHHHDMVEAEKNTKEYLKFGAVITAIATVSLYLTLQTPPEPSLLEATRWFMGVFLVTFAGFKLAGYRMFVTMFAGYDVVAKRLRAYAYVYPFLELGLGGLFLANIAPVPRNLATALVMGVAAVGVGREVRNKSGVRCACLGNVIKLPLSTVSFVENIAMAAMALGMLLLG